MLKNCLKVALKVLLRRKFFTAVSLFGIAFTMLVLLVATALLDEGFRPSPPEVHGERLLLVGRMSMQGPHTSRTAQAGYGFLDPHVRSMPGLEAFAITSGTERIVGYHEGRRIESYRRLADGAYWSILRFEFVEGGPYGPDDEAAGTRVAVINEATRGRYFGGGSAVGRTIELDGRPFRVSGVVRDVPLVRTLAFSDIWTPISTARSQSFRKDLIGDFVGLILAPSRAAVPGIQADLQRVVGEVQLPDPERFDRLYASADTYFEAIARDVFGEREGPAHPARLLALIVGAMLLFMLLPAINLVNLNLSRILERGAEIGVRKAFGASARMLVLQFVIENLVVTLIGAAVGLALAGLTLDALNRSAWLPYADFGLNARVFGYGLLLALVFGLVSGVYPAWKMSRLHPARILAGRSA
jgi:putative ABC transport system permease protein